MSSQTFDTLPKNERERIVRELFEYQHRLCYICEDANNPLDLSQPLDVDHIRSKDQGGLDSRNNWGLTHAHCNRAKGNRDLDLQRYVARFQKARRDHIQNGRGEDTFTVGVALDLASGAKKESAGRIERDSSGEVFVTTWERQDETVQVRLPIHTDPNNASVKSFTAQVPIEYVFHDGDLNPRSIVDVEPFIEEFYRGYPQLLPSLAHLSLDGQQASRRIKLFDGQHKAAAQLFLGNRTLYLRVFLNPDMDLLKATNFSAHTKLAQIHFPMAIQDKVGHDILSPAFEQYLNSLNNRTGILESSFFKKLSKEERSEAHAHFQGYLKFRVVSAVGADSGAFFKYVETVSPRSKTKPIAYETVRKAVFNNFLCLRDTDVAVDVALKMRNKERDNLAALLDLFTKKALDGQFDLSQGIYRIEERLSTDPAIRDPHLRAYRICRQAPLTVVMRELRDAIAQLLSLRGRYTDPKWDKQQVLWANLEQGDWDAVSKMFDYILSHKVWIERNPVHIRVLQDTRLKSWEEILLFGTLPGANEPVYEALNHAKLLQYVSHSGR